MNRATMKAVRDSHEGLAHHLAATVLVARDPKLRRHVVVAVGDEVLCLYAESDAARAALDRLASLADESVPAGSGE